MKFYVFYLKYDRSLYAFTTVKEYAERFLEERNPDCFKMKVLKLKGEKEKIFMYTNKLLMLSKFPYQNGADSYTELLATSKEDNKITEEIESIENMVNEIDSIFRTWPIKDKYRDIIERMTTIHDKHGHITLDVLSLFVDIHKNTFIEEKPIRNNELSVWDSHSDNVILYTF